MCVLVPDGVRWLSLGLREQGCAHMPGRGAQQALPLLCAFPRWSVCGHAPQKGPGHELVAAASTSQPLQCRAPLGRPAAERVCVRWLGLALYRALRKFFIASAAARLAAMPLCTSCGAAFLCADLICVAMYNTLYMVCGKQCAASWLLPLIAPQGRRAAFAHVRHRLGMPPCLLQQQQPQVQAGAFVVACLLV